MEASVENPSEFKERREYVRSLLDLPVDYRIKDLPHIHGGLVVNASEGGLLIHSPKDMPLGLKLRMAVLFLAGYELAQLDVTAEIIWKDFHSYNKTTEGFQYGLKIIQILEEDRGKLKRLLSSQFVSGENVRPFPFHSSTAPRE